nr:hypothetical protein [Bacillus tuaregi]
MGVQDNGNGRCRGCVCNQLRELQTGTSVDVFLCGGTMFAGLTFVNFNDDTCCAYFSENGSILVLDCGKVQALRVVNCCNGNG